MPQHPFQQQQELLQGFITEIQSDPLAFDIKKRREIIRLAKKYDVPGADTLKFGSLQPPLSSGLEFDPKFNTAEANSTAVSLEDPSSSLPKFLQLGYNRSIQGLSRQIITGDQKYDLSGYEANTIEDIAASISSFFQPADLAIMISGGGVGGVLAKQAVKQVAKTLAASKVKSAVAKRAAEAGVRRAITNAAALGAYSTAQTAVSGKVATGEFDPLESLLGGLKGAVTGAVAGGVAGSIAGGLSGAAGRLAAVARTTLPITAEIAAFGTVAPLLEGEKPTKENYVHAAGMILGLRAVHATAGKGLRVARAQLAKELKAEVEVAGKTLETAISGIVEKQTGKVPETPPTDFTIFESKSRRVQVIDQTVSKRGASILELEDALSGKRYTLSEKSFHKVFHLYEPPIPELAESMARQQTAAYAAKIRAPFRWTADRLRYFSEGLPDRVFRAGGEKSKAFANDARQVISDTHGILGELAVGESPGKGINDVLKVNASNPRRPLSNESKTSRFLTQKIDAPGSQGRFGQLMFAKVMEQNIQIPSYAKGIVEFNKFINKDLIGKRIEADVPEFTRSGKIANLATQQQVEIIMKGDKAPELATLIAAYEFYNPKKPPGHFAKLFGELSKKGNKEGADIIVRVLNQERKRHLVQVPSYIRYGSFVIPLFHHTPYQYFQQSAQRTAHRLAFRKTFGTDPDVVRDRVEAAREEMRPQDKDAVGDLMKALHGLSTDRGPTGAKGGAFRFARDVMSGIFEPMALSASLIPNLPEIIIGQSPRIIGIRNHVKGITSVYRDGKEGLNAVGALGLAIPDWSRDPTSKLRTGIRKFRNTGHIFTLNQWVNELQEASAAAGARVTVEGMKGGSFTERYKRGLAGNLEDFGFAPEVAKRMVNGLGSEAQYLQFQRSFAPGTTGGNRLLAEGARVQAGQIPSFFFRFMTYPRVALDKLIKPAERIFRKAREGKIDEAGTAFAQFVKQVGFNVGQGAAIVALKALVTGGFQGLEIGANEAVDEPGEALAEFFLSGVGGPLAIAVWMGGGIIGGAKGIGDALLTAVYPGSLAVEMTNLLRSVLGGDNSGPYSQTDGGFEATRLFFERVPLGKIISTWAGSIAYGHMSPGDQASLKAYYRWARDARLPRVSTRGGKDERRERQRYLQRAGKAIKAFNNKDTQTIKKSHERISFWLRKAFAIEEETLTPEKRQERIIDSLRSQKLLTRTRFGVSTEVERVELENRLIRRIGRQAFERLENHDKLLDAWVEAYLR